MQNPRKLVVIGHGAAGLTAAVAAAEQAGSLGLRIDITVLEKSSKEEAGGNTSWSPAYMRMAAPDRIAPGFEDDMLEASGGLADQSYFQTLAENAPATIGWLETHGVAFTTPIYYLAAGPPRIQPAGGGRGIVEKLADAATRAGVNIRYQCSAVELVMAAGDRARGVEILPDDGVATLIEADAVILATGGFQGNAAMMRTQFGPHGETLKLISPGTHFDTGDGIRMARDQGAAVS
jgi:tricarballylate dehydrogenase